mmetsp:Transcript_37209/g.61637  ORF Transcript_37209/g.61637 Transcript_37209/m.61637 type:complete len:388 (+) Transcript_37209:60-1223(+)
MPPVPRLRPGETVPVMLGDQALNFLSYPQLIQGFSTNKLSRLQLQRPGSNCLLEHSCAVCGDRNSEHFGIREADGLWVCVECEVNEFVDSKGGSLYRPSSRVLLCNLVTRADLNGLEGVLLAPTQREDAELRQKGRLKVRVRSETLAVPMPSVIIGRLSSPPLGHSDVFSVRHSSCGYGMFALRKIAADTIVLVEHPLLAYNVEPTAVLNHSEAQPLLMQLQAFAKSHAQCVNATLQGADAFPTEVRSAMDAIAEIQARDAFDRVCESTQRRCLSLHDVYKKAPEAEKTIGGVIRTNGYAAMISGHRFSMLYECFSRANHSCEPNLQRVIQQGTLYAYTTRDIWPGEELLTSYSPDSQGLPIKQRRRLLEMKHNFVCQCIRCMHEAV